MDPRTARHLIGAGIGVAAAPAGAFLVLDGIRGTVFLALQLQSSHVSPGLPPGTGIRVPAHGPWLATLEFATAAAMTGVLAGAKRISPVAPLVAALLLLAIHFYGHSSVGAFLEISRHAPADLMIAIQDAIISDVFLLLGGALVVAALAPWRWRTSELPPPWANWHAAGVLVGMAAVPLLWLILQLSEGASSSIGITGVRIFADEFLLFMLAGVVVVGVLASARWVSPVAAVIAGAPLFAVGLFTLVDPALAQALIDRLVDGQTWQPVTENLAASGWLVLFGGMLLAAGAMPGRWRGSPVPSPGGQRQRPDPLQGSH
jgi:hypothetical protein